MSKLQSEKYLLTEFNGFPIVEYGSMVNLSYYGDGSIDLLPGVFGTSLLMSKNGYFSLSFDSRYSNFRSEFTVGFWLNSVSRQDKIIGDNIYSSIMPVISIGRSVDQGDEFVLNNGLFCISEKCVFDKFNQLNFTLLGPDGRNHVFESELYECNIFNHFMFSVTAEGEDQIKLYINGVETVLTNVLDGVVPYILGTVGSFDFSINDSITGLKNQYDKNSGLIDDVFIVSQAIYENYKISKIISDGFASYIEETSGNIGEYIFEAKISFAQKTNISPPVTSIDSSSGDLIAGTQDGLVLKGDSGYWNKKYIISRESGLQDIKIVYASQEAEPDASDGKIDPGQGLVLIKNGIIIG